jgi:CDP-diacylglycerol---glycerol-3-phosphate 3-phosphatidyltransferase
MDSEKRRKYILVQLLTASRLPLALFFSAILMWTAESVILLLFLVLVLIVLELTDLFDGMLARRWRVSSEWGAMLDPYFDSISRITVYWGMACAGLVLPMVPLGMALRDVTVAYCRIIMTRHGKSVGAKWSGKIKAGFQAAGAIILVLGQAVFHWKGTGWTTAISWIIFIVTLASMVEYARFAMRAARESR